MELDENIPNSSTPLSREGLVFFFVFFIPERVQRVGGGISEVLDVNQITFFSVLG